MTKRLWQAIWSMYMPKAYTTKKTITYRITVDGKEIGQWKTKDCRDDYFVNIEVKC